LFQHAYEFDEDAAMSNNIFLSNFVRPAFPPKPRSDWALFLDLDGTLLDIAPAPDRVVVPDGLVRDLNAASIALGGALAIVSGRMMCEIDALLSPLFLACSGEHGAVIRMPSGQKDEIDVRIPESWVEALEIAAEERVGTFVERKAHTVAVHYRRAAQHEEFYRCFCADLINGHSGDYEILPGKLMLEIRPRTVNKARAVERLMSQEPFVGRKPVFIGDDATDHDGFRAAQAMGGEGYDVLVRFGGRPTEVRRWLKSVAAVNANSVQ
jgi:trehalose 6-phosphate phosphatase